MSIFNGFDDVLCEWLFKSMSGKELFVRCTITKFSVNHVFLTYETEFALFFSGAGKFCFSHGLR